MAVFEKVMLRNGISKEGAHGSYPTRDRMQVWIKFPMRLQRRYQPQESLEFGIGPFPRETVALLATSSLGTPADCGQQQGSFPPNGEITCFLGSQWESVEMRNNPLGQLNGGIDPELRSRPLDVRDRLSRWQRIAERPASKKVTDALKDRLIVDPERELERSVETGHSIFPSWPAPKPEASFSICKPRKPMPERFAVGKMRLNHGMFLLYRNSLGQSCSGVGAPEQLVFSTSFHASLQAQEVDNGGL